MALDRGLCCRYNDSTDSRKKKTKQKEKQKHLEGATKKRQHLYRLNMRRFQPKQQQNHPLPNFLQNQSIHKTNS